MKVVMVCNDCGNGDRHAFSAVTILLNDRMGNITVMQCDKCKSTSVRKRQID
jgi:hypothetical protein